MKTVVSFLFLVVALFVLVCPTFAQDDKFAKAIEKALVDGERTAVKDANGKVKQMEIEYFSPKQTVEFGYEKDTLASVTLGDGTKMTILRNEKGGIDGFAFPDGRKAFFLWKKTPNFDFSLPAGVKFVSPDGKETIIPLSKGSEKESPFSKVAFRSSSRECTRAISAAAVATAAAAVACADGGLDCFTAVAAAAIAIANAADACTEQLQQD